MVDVEVTVVGKELGGCFKEDVLDDIVVKGFVRAKDGNGFKDVYATVKTVKTVKTGWLGNLTTLTYILECKDEQNALDTRKAILAAVSDPYYKFRYLPMTVYGNWRKITIFNPYQFRE